MRSKKQLGMRCYVLLCVVVSLLMAACGESAGTTAAVESVAVVSTVVEVSAETATLVPTIAGIIPTPLPSATPTSVPTAPPPTIPPTATASPVPTLAPSATATSTATPTLAPDEPTSTPEPVSRAILRTQIKFTQTKLRDLVFLLNQASQFGTLDCEMFTFNYEELADGSQFYYADTALVIADQFYDRAVVQGLLAFEPVYLTCEDVGKDEVKSADFTSLLLLDTKEQGAVIMADINDALLWVNGDNLIARDVYSAMQIDLANYAAQLAAGTTDRCSDIHALYQEINAAPQFSPPIGYRLNAYFNYLDALTFIEQGSLQLDLLCTEHLARTDEDGEPALPLQPDALRIANWTASRARTAIELALDLLPESDPLPAPVPVYGEVVSTELVDDDTFEVVLRVYVRVGTPPYSATVDGFAMQPNGRIAVQHSCGTDLNGSILVTDAEGAQFESELFTVSQADVCQ